MPDVSCARKWAEYKEIVEKRLEELLPEGGCDGIPALQGNSMRYSITAGGKRLRPVLFLAAVDALGGDVTAARTFACALEMIHTYSLIHDDLPAMDNDVLRRGRPTNHVVYGDGQAVLAGDGLLNYAYECVLNEAVTLAPDRALCELRALKSLAEGAGASGMVAGQCADLACERDEQQTYACILDEKTHSREEMLRYIHEHKTACLLTAPFACACAFTGAGQEECDALLAFARPFGLLFQVVDDILDAVGDPALLGKSVGKDADSGKLTYVTLYGMDGATQKRDAIIAEAENALAAIPNNDFFAYALAQMAHRNS